MTARELTALIGTYVFLEAARGLRVRCKVIDAKTGFGHPRIQIEAPPGAGEGRAWVNVASVQPERLQPEAAELVDPAQDGQPATFAPRAPKPRTSFRAGSDAVSASAPERSAHQHGR